MGLGRISSIRSSAVALAIGVALLGPGVGGARAGAQTDIEPRLVGIVPIYFGDAPPPGDPLAAMARAVAGSDAYYRDVSGGKTRIALAPGSPSWQHVSVSDDVIARCDARAMGAAMEQQVLLPPAYEVLLVQIPENPACDFDVQPTVHWLEDGSGTVLNGIAPSADLLTQLFAVIRLDEMNGRGPTALRCVDSAGTPVPFSDDCTVGASDDPWSPNRWDFASNRWPSWGQPPRFGYPHPREMLKDVNYFGQATWNPEGQGWARIPTDAGPQVVEINRVQPLGQSVQAVRFELDDYGYEVEYRTPTGMDRWIDDATYVDGAGVRRTTPGGGVILTRAWDANPYASVEVPQMDESVPQLIYLHLPTPGAEVTKRHPGLDVGESYTAPNGEFRIEVLAGAAEKARVRVSFPAFEKVARWWGSDRYAASAAIAAHAYPPGVTTAYVASGAVFTDALTGAPVAGKNHNPVLLTSATKLPDAIADALRRLQPDRIVVFGGENSISVDVLDDIRAVTGAPLVRVADTDRFTTSALISRTTYAAGADTVYVASGRVFPDALSAAPVAGAHGSPLLLVDTDHVPAAIGTELARLAPRRIVIVGGPATVSPDVEGALGAYAGVVQRISGPDRFATSAAIAASSARAGGTVYVASGRAFPDALSGAPVAAGGSAPILLVDTDAIPGVIAETLHRLKPRRIVVLGGPGTVTDRTRAQLSTFVVR